MIRKNFWGVVSQNETYLKILKPPKDYYEPLVHDLDHTFHCLDYLRKTVLCNADLTIEWEAIERGVSGHSGHIDGYKIPHQCKNWVSNVSEASYNNISGY